MEIEYEHRLTEVEGRSKSNTHRIDKLEKDHEAINRLATSMEVMVTEQKHQTEAMTDIKNDVARLDSKVEAIEQKPAKRWDGIVEKIILTTVGIIVGAIFAKFGF